MHRGKKHHPKIIRKERKNANNSLRSVSDKRAQDNLVSNKGAMESNASIRGTLDNSSDIVYTVHDIFGVRAWKRIDF